MCSGFLFFALNFSVIFVYSSLDLLFIVVSMQKRKLGVQEPKQLKKNLRLWKWAIALLCIIGVFLLVKPYAEYLKGLVSSTGKNVIKVVSQTVGTEMKKDQF